MKRRSFLKWSMGTGLVTALGVPLLTACSGVKRGDFSASEGPVLGLDGESARILWHLLFAPEWNLPAPIS